MAIMIGAAPSHGTLPDNAAADTNSAIQPGEALVFDIRWGFIRAGEALMEALP